MRKKVAKRLKWKTKVDKIGRTITKEDKSYELMFDMLLGIRQSVVKVAKKRMIRDLSSQDFKEVLDFKFPRCAVVKVTFCSNSALVLGHRQLLHTQDVILRFAITHPESSTACVRDT